MSTLGIFDSGLGGLTVLRKVRERLPSVDLVYLADQAHLPYGDRSDAQLLELLAHNIGYLQEAQAAAIVMGCNTSCAVASRRGWPPSRVPVLDLIESAARAVAATGVTRVGVLATAATIRSGAYGRALRAERADLHVTEVAAPKLVPLVESGLLEGPIVRAAIAESLAEFPAPLDALVLGCTHYPLLDAEFAALLGPSVALVDPADAMAHTTVAFARANGLTEGSGRTAFATTGSLEAFRGALASILGSPRDGVTLEVAAIAALSSR